MSFAWLQAGFVRAYFKGARAAQDAQSQRTSSMTTTELDLEVFRVAAQKLPADGPVFMLNLLRYRDQALYEGRPDEPPCSGRDAYHQRYLPTFQRLAESTDYKLTFVGSVLAKLAGPEGAQWDDVAIVEYASYAEFCGVVDSERYREEANHHRLAALEDFRLFVTNKQNIGVE
jgi:hypothetical protein